MLTRRNEVGTEVAKRRHASVFDRRQEPAEAATRRLVQEDPFDRRSGAELERLLQGGFRQMLNR
jgi:hypothetical protein